MNIINTLTLRHLKLNKQRTIVTIIGVILSVAMITAVATFVSSFLNMMQKNAIAQSGNWHVLYSDVQSQNINSVINDANTASAALSKDIGYAVLEGSKNADKPYLFIKAYDEQSMKTFNLDLVEGHFPQNPNEIVISAQIAENGGVKYQVGDKIKLDVGRRYLVEGEKERSLGQDSSFKKQNEDKSGEGEKLLVESSKEYTVTGMISRPGFEPYWAPGYTVISYLDKNELAPADTVNLSVTWNKVNKKVNEQANELAGNIGVSEVSYNRDLLRFYGIIGDHLLSTLYSLAAVVTVLIIIGSVALIYNSFAISISERSRHLGMLASVGATKKQKRNSIFFESFVVGIIGIPLGIIFGTLGMGITFALVQPLIQNSLNTGVKLTLVTSPTTILAAALLSVLTIFISAYIPAKRAAKTSPMEAIRQSKDVKLTVQNVKTSKLTRLLFGFEAELGLKNLKRNSRRYKITVFSLVLSIVLFLSVSSLSLLTQKSADLVLSSTPYDVSVFVTSSATAQEKKDFYTAIAKMDDVDQAVIQQTMEAESTIDSDSIPSDLKEIMQPNNQKQNTETYVTRIQIKSIDDEALNRYAKEAGTDVARLKDTRNPCGILFNTVTLKTADNKYTRMNSFSIEAGEKLNFNIIADGYNDYNMELEVVALADKTPIGETGETALTNTPGAMLIVAAEVYAGMQANLPERFNYTNVQMFINSSDPAGLVESIKEYQKHTSIGQVYISDVAASNKRNEQVVTLFSVFSYGFVALIAAICVANIFNTISTSISLRKREFATLKSIGMTPKGFTKMINYESLFYGIKALLYGLPISFGIIYLIYKVLSNSFEFSFVIPWGSIIGAIIAVFAIVGSTMLYASSRIKKENIIDVLKNENI